MMLPHRLLTDLKPSVTSVRALSIPEANSRLKDGLGRPIILEVGTHLDMS